MHPLCLSIPLHPSLSHDEMDDDEHAWGTEGGRDGLYLLNTWWMWSLGLKGLGGQVAHWEQERACEWQRAPSSAPCCSLSQSLYPPPWRETQRIQQLTRQSKGRLKHCFLCCFFKKKYIQIRAIRGERKKTGSRRSDAHLFIQPTQSVSKLQHQRGGERMLNNMTDCEEGEGGPNSQGEWSNLLQSERGVWRGVCGHESAW